MNVPGWYAELLDMPYESRGSVEFCRRFFQAPIEERRAIQAAWDPALRWDLVEPFRICYGGEPPAIAVERAKSRVLRRALSMELPGREPREDIFALAVFYNIVALLGEDADRLFRDVSSIVGPVGRQALDEFVGRSPDEKGLSAFKLHETVESDGGRRLVPEPP